MPFLRGRSDDVLAAARAGSVEALGALYRRHAEAVYAAAFRITGSQADAEDVVQDTFVGLPRALQSYDDRGSLEAWLCRVATRVALMRQRARRRHDAYALAAWAVRPAPPVAHPIDRVALQRALDRLPEKLRVVFVLREVEGYTHAEIAAMTGISAGASAMRVHRAWEALRKEMEP